MPTRPRKLPASVRPPLLRRIAEAEQQLADLHIDPHLWKRLVPFVRFTASGAFVEMEAEPSARELGPRFRTLPQPVRTPTRVELQAEAERLTAAGEVDRLMADEGVDADAAVELVQLAAEALLFREGMAEQGRPAWAERETPPWEAAASAAVAWGVLHNASPAALTAGREYFEALDRARRYAEERQGRLTAEAGAAAQTRTDRTRRQNAAAATAAKKRTHADYHRDCAREILAENPEQSKALIADTLAAECNRAGRRCTAETIRTHHLRGLN